MAERATVFQGVQVGVETTPGTAVAANKRLAATSIEPSIKSTVNNFKPMGTKYTTITALGKEWVEAKIAGQMTYTDWVYLLACGVAYNAPVQQGATTAYKWTSAPGQSAADVIKTLSVEVGGSVRAHKYANSVATSLGYTLDREKFEVKGSMMGTRISDGITMTSSPGTIPLMPVLPNQVDIFCDTASAGLGTTRLTRVLSVDFENNDRLGPVWPLDSTQTSYAATVETEPKASFKIMVEADSNGMAFLSNLRAGTPAFFRVQATGPLIATPYNYLWQHDVCGEVVDVGEFRDENGVYAIEWTFAPTFDGTWGKAFEFNVINALTAL